MWGETRGMKKRGFFYWRRRKGTITYVRVESGRSLRLSTDGQAHDILRSRSGIGSLGTPLITRHPSSIHPILFVLFVWLLSLLLILVFVDTVKETACLPCSPCASPLFLSSHTHSLGS